MNIKTSIGAKWAFILGAMVIIILMVGLVINNLFFYDFYLSKEKSHMLSFVESLNDNYDDDAKLSDLIELYVLQNQASIQVIDDNDHFHFSFGNVMNGNFRGNSMRSGSTVSIPYSAEETLETQGYAFFEFEHTALKTNLLALIYDLESGETLLVAIPFEELSRTANYAVEFNLYVAVLLVLVSMLVIYLLAKKMTQPIVKLSKITQQIAQLDFAARYDGGESDEIGMLGTNINSMSQALEDALKDLKTANAQLIVDLEEKEKLVNMRKSFLANVSHELKTPIALIMSYIEGLRDNQTLDGDQQAYYFDVITKETQHMNHLVRDLLNLAELEYDAFRLKLSTFDFSSLIDEILDRYILLISQKQLKIRLNKEDILMMTGDKKRLEQAVNNLIVNALEHVDVGGEILLDVRDEEIFKFTIKNTGSHIPEALLPTIFDSFSKREQHKRIGGSGIGLSIVKAVVEKHQGSCQATNLDDGVEFSFQIPKAGSE